MLTYIARRIAQMIPVFIGVTIILFILRSPGVIGGDPVRMITGEKAISETLYNQIVERHGLDKPFYVQYGKYMVDLVQETWVTLIRRAVRSQISCSISSRTPCGWPLPPL